MSPPTTSSSSQQEIPGSEAGTPGVAANIQKALDQEPNLASANISATISGDKVELTGTVANKEQKKTAKQIAESNAGGIKVVDHLKVESKAGNNTATPKNH